MPEAFPVTHSIPSWAALLHEVTRRHDVGAPQSCVLLHVGLNDSYLIRTEHDRWVLRVYRTGWRSQAAIQWELDLLVHLAEHGCSVSTPVPQRDGEPIWTLHAPEGDRYAVLFTHAAGVNPYANQETEEKAYTYGAAVAALHLAMRDFTSPRARFALDMAHLVDAPLQAIEAFLAHRQDDWHYLLSLGERLKAHVATSVAAGLGWGTCHGDCHGGNAHLAGERLTFFDFDCGGPGWWAYDLGVFLWSAMWNEKDDVLMPAYLAGYQSQRPLAMAEQAALATFAAIRQIWLMGLWAGNSGDWGTAWLDDRRYDRELAFLRTCEARVFA